MRFLIENGILKGYEPSSDKPETKLIIPEGVVEIDYNFQRCGKQYISEIEELYFPGTLKRINELSFNRLEKLRYISFNDQLEEIIGEAFGCCYSLKELRFPPNLKVIGDWAFQACPLGDLVIPDSVVDIGRQAFIGACRGNRVKLSKNVKRLNFGVFARNFDFILEVFGNVYISDGAFYNSRDIEILRHMVKGYDENGDPQEEIIRSVYRPVFSK